MPIGPDTDRQGSGRIDRNLHYGGSLDRFEEEMDDDFRHDDAERAARLEEEEDREIADYDESGQPVRNFPPRNQYLNPEHRPE